VPLSGQLLPTVESSQFDRVGKYAPARICTQGEGESGDENEDGDENKGWLGMYDCREHILSVKIHEY